VCAVCCALCVLCAVCCVLCVLCAVCAVSCVLGSKFEHPGKAGEVDYSS
jgi:hypothetical protein